MRAATYAWETPRLRRQQVRILVRRLCGGAGIPAVKLGSYCCFALELARHIGLYAGAGLTGRIARYLVARWTAKGLEENLLRELACRIIDCEMGEG